MLSSDAGVTLIVLAAVVAAARLAFLVSSCCHLFCKFSILFEISPREKAVVSASVL